MEKYHGTTIISIRKNNTVVIGGDGQVTLGNTILKNNAKKIRSLYNNQILSGFAGATADAFTLFEKFENKLVVDKSTYRHVRVNNNRKLECSFWY